MNIRLEGRIISRPEEGESIWVFEDDEGRRWRVPGKAIRGSPDVGTRAVYDILVIAGNAIDGSLKPEGWLPVGKRPSPPLPSKRTVEAVIVEVPSELNADSFRMDGPDGHRYELKQRPSQDFWQVDDLCLVHLLDDRPVSISRPEGEGSVDLPVSPGRVNVIGGNTRIWSGYRWLSAGEAMDDYWFHPSEVGTLLKSVPVGWGGAPTYVIEARFWKVGDVVVLELEDGGDGRETYDTLAEAEEAAERVREQYGEPD